MLLFSFCVYVPIWRRRDNLAEIPGEHTYPHTHAHCPDHMSPTVTGKGGREKLPTETCRKVTLFRAADISRTEIRPCSC